MASGSSKTSTGYWVTLSVVMTTVGLTLLAIAEAAVGDTDVEPSTVVGATEEMITVAGLGVTETDIGYP
jgi:hypothetical protein